MMKRWCEAFRQENEAIPRDHCFGMWKGENGVGGAMASKRTGRAHILNARDQIVVLRHGQMGRVLASCSQPVS